MQKKFRGWKKEKKRRKEAFPGKSLSSEALNSKILKTNQMDLKLTESQEMTVLTGNFNEEINKEQISLVRTL